MTKDGASTAEPVDLQSVSELTEDYKVFQARNSKAYVAMMVDITAAINGCPMGKLKNIDIEEIKGQTGHLINYQIKGVEDAIPCDLEFVPQLYSHFRRPTVLVLKRIQKHMMANHRRVLARLEREQALEKIVDMTSFDVSSKIRLALEEIARYQKMSTMVRGGGRKLDILMQALQVPSRTRFDLLMVDRILRDPHHPRHHEAMEWVSRSKFKGNAKAVHSLINNGFQVLDNAANRILDIMEDLSGLQLSRDTTNVDVHRSWYALGNTLPRGEDFVKSFTAEEQVEQRIKRLTFPMVRIGWDAERLRATKDRFIVELNVPKIQAAQLSNLFFEIEKKIESSTKPDGEVMAAIQTDFENGMLSNRERDEAERWVRDNKIKLQELMMEVHEALHEIKKSNPNIALPEKLESTLERIKSGLAGDRSDSLQDIEGELNNLNVGDLERRLAQLEKKMENPDGELLQELADLRDEINKRIDRISIKNIDFHQKVRETFQDFQEYENKVLELYKLEEQLEHMRVNSENWLLDVFRMCSYKGIQERTLHRCMGVVVDHMLNHLRKLDYRVIDGDAFESYLEAAVKQDADESVLRLDMLLQELEAVPKAEQLLNALQGWEKDLDKDKYKEKESYILSNSEKLQEVVDKARAELRERLGNSRVQSRRLRFEVFGLSDVLAETLKTLLDSMMAMAPRVADAKEGEQLISSLQTLESQIIEAQRVTKPGGDAYKKLSQMEANKQLDPNLIRDLHRDLELNFTDLDQLLEETGQALKRVRHLQNRFGAKKDTDYLDVTLNINDLDRLKDVYDFIDTVTMEDIKRFCVAYNLKSGLLESLFQKAKKKDISVPAEVMQQFNSKAYKLFRDKRYISLQMKTAIYKASKEIFEAETQLLCHTLNLVQPEHIRKKAGYVGFLAILEQAKKGDPHLTKLLGLVWGRTQTRLFNYKPKNHQKNFEGNRQALLTDVKEVTGDAFKR